MIENFELIENEDGSATVSFDCTPEFRQYLLDLGFSALLLMSIHKVTNLSELFPRNSEDVE